MICPKCSKPYLFIDKSNNNRSICLRCNYACDFEMPNYDSYHKNLYLDRKYRRDVGSDPEMKFIFDRMNINENDTVLDLGCGIGDYTKEIHKITKNVIGADQDVEAASYLKDIKFECLNCNKALEYKDNFFDKIISVNLIEHLVDFRLFLSETKRILKCGGKISLVTADIDFFLHDYHYDKTHLHEWNMGQFKKIVKEFFNIETATKSSSMFKYYPINKITTKFIKPDLLIIGKK